jgi:hypothetical protein
MGLFSASCVSAGPAYGRKVSFQDTLVTLNSVTTLSEFESAIGRSGFVNYFAHDDEDNSYRGFRNGRDYWNKLYISNPPGLMQIIAPRTRMINFEFLFNQPINPTSGRLFVCVDGNDRIIGWLYSRTLVGHEREAMPG